MRPQETAWPATPLVPLVLALFPRIVSLAEPTQLSMLEPKPAHAPLLLWPTTLLATVSRLAATKPAPLVMETQSTSAKSANPTPTEETPWLPEVSATVTLVSS